MPPSKLLVKPGLSVCSYIRRSQRFPLSNCTPLHALPNLNVPTFTSKTPTDSWVKLQTFLSPSFLSLTHNYHPKPRYHHQIQWDLSSWFLKIHSAAQLSGLCDTHPLSPPLTPPQMVLQGPSLGPRSPFLCSPQSSVCSDTLLLDLSGQSGHLPVSPGF